MTENELRQKVAEMARSYIGCKEADGTHKPIIDLYNKIAPLPRGYKMKYTDPWCAAFASVVFSNCGLLSIAPAECSCDYMIARYKAIGRWEENDAYNAQIGDPIFYDWEDDGKGDDVGSSDHVGIIVGKSGGQFVVVEGNKSDAVGYRTVAVNGKYIRGFGKPDYASAADGDTPAPQPSPAPTPSAQTYTVELPLLAYGSKGRTVHAMQSILIGDGYKCGWWGADGDFGDSTLKALKKFQTTFGLKVDGECGGETWKALLGV